VKLIEIFGVAKEVQNLCERTTLLYYT